jgi:hypothetical protein
MKTAEQAAEPATPIPAMPRIGDPDEALAAAQNVTTNQAPTTALDPKTAEEYTFDIDIVDGAGKHLKGTFTNKILSIEERMNVGLSVARMTGGIPYISLDEESAGLIETVAQLNACLKKPWPPWFVLYGDDALKSTRALYAIFAEVAAHEATFRGPSKAPPPSKS